MFSFVIVATLFVSTLAGVPRTLPIQMQLPSGGRIIGGENANIEEVPYQVALLRYGSFSCGGSIIRPDAILSAAHCTEGPVSSYSFRAGSDRHYTGGQVIGASSLKNHEQYTGPPRYDYDISIIKLAASFSLGASVAVITLPIQDQPVNAGCLGITSGWGTTQEGVNAFPEFLQKVTIPVVDQETCRYLYETLENREVTSRMFCAGLLQTGGQDACQGDSGGPFVVDGEILGVTSWGIGCARPQLSGVWARVPFFIDWINLNYNAMKRQSLSM